MKGETNPHPYRPKSKRFGDPSLSRRDDHWPRLNTQSSHWDANRLRDKMIFASAGLSPTGTINPKR
jgi:hypothetical protein